jgi:hypothetical protein
MGNYSRKDAHTETETETETECVRACLCRYLPGKRSPRRAYRVPQGEWAKFSAWIQVLTTTTTLA